MTDSEKIAFLASREVQDFLEKNLRADPADFLLHAPKAWIPIKNLIADQLVARLKVAKKLPGWSSTSGVIYPPSLSVEQCSSETTAAYKAGIIQGKHLIDLTGGMGVDCLLMAPNFQQVSYVEQQEWLCQIFTHNASVFNQNVRVVHTTAELFAKSFKGNATFFIDPARRSTGNQKVFRLEDCTPNLTQLLPEILPKAEKILIKLSPMLDIKAGIAELKPRQVHVVAVANECKELLFLLDSAQMESLQTPEIVCSHYLSGHWQKFAFDFVAEQTSTTTYAEVNDYVYDANPAIIKAGAFKTIANQFGVQKLAVNTHLYTSTKPVSDFPGRIFHVIQKDVPAKRLQEFLSKNKANLVTRNYPVGTDDLRRQLKIKDGGEDYLIGFRDMYAKPRLILAKLFSQTTKSD